MSRIHHIERITGSSGETVIRFEDGAEFDGKIEGTEGGAVTLDYALYTSSVTVNLDAPDDTTWAEAEGISGVRHIQHITGGSGDDHLTGNSEDNTIRGGAGKDEIMGREGDDVIYGDQGHDVIYGGLGDDTISGGAGDDNLEGGVGNDVFYGGAGENVMSGGAGNDEVSYEDATSSVTVNLNITGKQNTGGGGFDTISGIENITGSDYADKLIGNEDGNIIYARGSDDELFGGKGDDVLEGGEGNGEISGGRGSNIVSYEHASGGVTIDLRNVVQTNAATGTDRLHNIQGIVGSAHNDSLTGDETRNIIDGGDGSDTIYGGAGLDVLIGGAGADIIYGEADDDLMFGGDGNDIIYAGGGVDVLEGGAGDDELYGEGDDDTASYQEAEGAVVVDLRISVQQNTIGAGSDLLADISNLIGSNFNDTLTGNIDVNFISGLGGDDIIIASGGGDTIFGNAGFDTISYIEATTGVTVDLDNPENNEGLAEGDVFFSIERINGSDHNDTLRGNDSDNYLFGGAGDDVLEGGAGDDVLEGGGGADELIGGDGLDTASYGGANAGVTVNLADNTVNTGEATSDSYIEIENLIGSAYADILTGNDSDNTIAGGLGGDVISGGGGINTVSYADADSGVTVNLLNSGLNTGEADGDTYNNIIQITGSDFADVLIGDLNANTILGGGGDDFIDGKAGDDTLEGGGGNDVIIGGAGIDTVSYAHDESGVIVSLDGDAIDGNNDTDSLLDIENVTGSDFNDILAGSIFTNVLDGGQGDDVLLSSQGGDTLIGGEGIDLVSYATAGSKVIVDLLSETGGIVANQDKDSLETIENIEGSSYDDILWGDDFANTIMGGDGNDILYGRGGDDQLEGGLGDDRLEGGAGDDTAAYITASDGVVVNLELGAIAQDTVSAGEDTLISIVHVTGSLFDDILTGDTANNRLDGLEGDDTISGGGGDDTLFGRQGNDIINGNLGDDTIDGGKGDDTLNGGLGSGDTLSYAQDEDGVTVDLLNQIATDGFENTDTLAGFENVTGSGFDDILLGDNNSNVLMGGDGDDEIHGLAGNDTIEGGDGDDFANGGTGVDTISYASAGVGVDVDLSLTGEQFTVGAGSDALMGFENIVGSAFDDVLTGNDGDNVLNGGDGDDVLEGGVGADTLIGGDGSDTASYANADPVTVLVFFNTGVTVNLADPTVNTGEAVGDTYNGIENLEGSEHNDHLIGDSNDNVLIGGLGADDLDGGGGVDTASYFDSEEGLTISLADNTINTGEAEGDTFDASILNLEGSFFNDVLVGNDLGNVLRGLEGDDLIIDSTGDDTLDGGFGEDTLSYETATAGVTVDLGDAERQETFGAGNDLILGIENLIGSIYADTLTGNDGDNILIGGKGGDTLNGGEGIDTASYRNAEGDVTADLRGTVTGVGDALGDSFAEIENLTGSDHHDVLHGDDEDNILDGGLGNDHIFGWGGDEFLIGGLGIDQLDGGADTDAVSYLYSDSDGGVTARLGGTGDDGVDVDTMLVNLEILIGSDFDDVLTGDGNNNILIGGLGDDVLEGRGGEDILSGGAGNDTASYANAPVVTGPNGGVTVSLVDPTLNTGEATNDRYILVENLIGSAFDDRLTGDSGNNTLMGGPGADYLDGGDDGVDLVSYANASLGLTVDLLTPVNNTGEAAGDTFNGISGIIGSAFNDNLFGDNGDNILIGGLGNDSLDGRMGNDTVSYITQDVSAGETGVTVDLGVIGIQNTIVAGNDQLSGFENLEGTRGNDILIGDSGDNIIIGHGGADVISGGGGNDIFVAGSGDDTYGLAEGADSLTIIDPEKIVFTASDQFIVKGDLNLISGSGIELGENVVITPTESGNVTLAAPDILLKPGSAIVTDGDITLTASNSRSIFLVRF